MMLFGNWYEVLFDIVHSSSDKSWGFDRIKSENGIQRYSSKYKPLNFKDYSFEYKLYNFRFLPNKYKCFDIVILVYIIIIIIIIIITTIIIIIIIIINLIKSHRGCASFLGTLILL
jgi:hypothetical protein